MKAPKGTWLARLVRAAGGTLLALLICLGAVGCATIDIDARGYRKYWEPFVPRQVPESEGGSGVSSEETGPERGITYQSGIW